MDPEDYPSWQDEYRVASRKEDVEFVVGKVKHYSQHQLYTKIRQLDEWCETLDSRQEKHARRMRQLGLSFENPRQSSTALTAKQTASKAKEATQSTDSSSDEANGDSEIGQSESS